jgi:death-on-curing protein
VRYLTAEQILFIHSRLIDETGGIHGIRDVALLLSAVSRSKATFEKKDLYPDIFHKAAVLMESLIKNHPFVDGNKRTAITSAGIFLQRNGYYLNAPQIELEQFAIDMAMGKVSIFKAVGWFKRHSVKTGLSRR